MSPKSAKIKQNLKKGTKQIKKLGTKIKSKRDARSTKNALKPRNTTVYYSRKTGLPIDPLAKKKQAAKAKAAKSAKRPVRSYKTLLKSLFNADKKRLKLTEADLINAESALGATLFGPVPKGHRREFFRFKHNVWIFHESWMEGSEKRESTITYEVRENGVYKLPLGGEYIKIKGRELENFCKATAEYLKLIKTKLY